MRSLKHDHTTPPNPTSAFSTSACRRPTAFRRLPRRLPRRDRKDFQTRSPSVDCGRFPSPYFKYRPGRERPARRLRSVAQSDGVDCSGCTRLPSIALLHRAPSARTLGSARRNGQPPGQIIGKSPGSIVFSRPIRSATCRRTLHPRSSQQSRRRALARAPPPDGQGDLHRRHQSTTALEARPGSTGFSTALSARAVFCDYDRHW